MQNSFLRPVWFSARLSGALHLLFASGWGALESELIKVVQDIAGASSERRAGTMRRLAGFLLSEGARLSEAQMQVFDQLLLELVNSCDTQELTELAGKLAAAAFALASTIKHLASHSDIRVAGPVQNDSPRLSNDDLLEVAASHGQKHLLAISKRSAIDTTELVIRGRLTAAAADLAKLRRQFDELSVTIAKRTLTIWKDQALGPRRLAS